MSAESLRRLPFDHYARYRLAADVVEATRGDGLSTVLDVGGGPGSLQAFLPDLSVASDLHFPSRWHVPAPTLVLADGARLPFADASFDIVVTLDTLEHVPPDHRPTLLDEAVRVSRGWVLVACPCATPGVADADAALLAYVRQRFGEEFETVEVLTEHLHFGHPEPADVEARLGAGGAEVARFPSGRLDRWLPMMVLFYHLLALGRDDPVERVQAWYNSLFYRDDLRAPAYRQAFLARLPGAAGPPLEAVIGGLLPQGPSETDDTVVLEAMRLGLSEELTEVIRSQRERVAELEVAAQAAQDQAAAEAARADAAEERVAALEGFRERVLNHPLVRARRAVKRALGRG